MATMRARGDKERAKGQAVANQQVGDWARSEEGKWLG